MKLSIETKVASVVAAGFLAVTVGVVAQANGVATAAGPDNYGLTSNSGANPDVIQQEYRQSANTPVKTSVGNDVRGGAGL